MVHLPAANGGSPRTIHRSKWFGASWFGRKFLEGLICWDQSDVMLSRRNQTAFRTDGILAERQYEGSYIERYFVPDELQGLSWTVSGISSGMVELYFDMRYQRASKESEYGYFAELDGETLLVSRTVEMLGAGAEGVDTGGTSEELKETLWAACRVWRGSIELRASPDRWRPMWYSLDAARRRYLRRLAQRNVPAIEHAPLWELTSEWVYSPVSVSLEAGAEISVGFGLSREEALEACTRLYADRSSLEEEKRNAQRRLLEASRFKTGHRATDLAYSHVLSRTVDCLIVRGETGRSTGADSDPAILAGDAYFQEAWKRDENIALGGLLAAGQYEIARRIIDASWRRQDPATGRLPLRFRAGEIPGYTSSDGTLWALARLRQYVDDSGDCDLLDRKADMICHFFRQSIEHCRDGLLPSGGVAVKEHEWETWMDTEFSARSGYPIEIQLLWLACLSKFETYVAEVDPSLAASMRVTAEALWVSLDRFNAGDFFVDHLDRGLQPTPLFTPNGYFWSLLGLDFDWEWEERSLAVGRRELGGISGVRTLARSQWATVLGPQIAELARQDRPLPSAGKVNYHRGVEWNWLAQIFVAGQLKHGHADLAYEHHLARQIYDSISMAGLGGISEVFDHRGPAGPDFQAWSMCGLIESLHRFAGVSIDVSHCQMRIAPLKPRRWPELSIRKWYDGVPIDIEYRSTPGTQRLAVTFQKEPARWPELSVELQLPRGRTPRMVSVQTPEGALPVHDIQVREEPHRVILVLRAGPSQSIRVSI